MTLRFGKPVFIYFCAAMITLIASVSGGIYFYWSQGPADIDQVASVFESTVQLDSLRSRGGIEKVRELVRSDRSREAISYFETFKNKIGSLNQLESVEEYGQLDNNLEKLQKALNSMLGFSSKTTLINVLRAKVTNFESFVINNQWRTLTRVSKKINAKISITEARNPSFFSFKKMNRLNKSISSDIDYMEAVTKSSVLSAEDKNLIYIKLDTLRKEMKMLSKSIASLKSFYNSYGKTAQSYKDWIKAIEPALALKKINIVKNSQTILYGMFAVLTLLVTLMIGGFVVYTKGGRKQRVEAEKEFLETIKEGLIPVHANLRSTWSQDFKDEIEKYREYMHKRMSFGSIFQDAMPFSSILLDSNLNMVWANTLFYEHWSLGDKVKNDSNISWDFLQRYTNLGENDPVLCAIKENVAGIYQIQVKTENHEEAAPFEMYVSPVEYAGQKRIMVIFYPLRSLEETLGNQMKSLVSPVTKTLDSLIEGKFNGDFKDRVQEDFEAAGIEHIYSKFDKVNDFFVQQKSGLLSEIEQIEATLFEQYKMVDDIKIVAGSQKDLQKDAVNKFKNTKDHIISIVDLRSQLESVITQMTSHGDKLFEEEIELLSKAGDINDQMLENAKALESLVTSRDEFKRLKSQVELYRSRVSQILDHAKGTDLSTGQGAQSMTRLRSELHEFETILSAFSRVSTSLDVGLSKVQIIMKGKQMPSLEENKQRFENLRTQMEELSLESSKLSRAGQEKDEELIKSLKGQYIGFQNLLSKSKEIDMMIFENENPQGDFHPVINEFDGEQVAQ